MLLDVFLTVDLDESLDALSSNSRVKLITSFHAVEKGVNGVVFSVQGVVQDAFLEQVLLVQDIKAKGLWALPESRVIDDYEDSFPQVVDQELSIVKYLFSCQELAVHYVDEDSVKNDFDN